VRNARQLTVKHQPKPWEEITMKKNGEVSAKKVLDAGKQVARHGGDGNVRVQEDGVAQ
jgi:hypothetical protein